MDLLFLQEENISDLELRVDWLSSKDYDVFFCKAEYASVSHWVEGRQVRFQESPGNIGLVSIVLLLKEVCRECGAVLLGGGPQACLVLAVSVFEFFR